MVGGGRATLICMALKASFVRDINRSVVLRRGLALDADPEFQRALRTHQVACVPRPTLASIGSRSGYSHDTTASAVMAKGMILLPSRRHGSFGTTPAAGKGPNAAP